MMKRVAIVGALLAGSALVAQAGHGLTFTEALEKAEKTDQPVLVKVGTEWCSACNAFSAAVAENAELQGAIAADAILVQVDAEKGAGVDLAKSYGVKAYPTFLLTDAEGELLDRWTGFKNAAGFTEALAHATEDMMPVSERMARFRSEPTGKDATKLGWLAMSEGHHAQARAYFERAMELDKTMNLSMPVFRATANGVKDGLYTSSDLAGAADAVFASSAGEEGLYGVLWAMKETARHEGNDDLYVPYLKAAIETTEDAEGEAMARYRSYYAADYTLFVEKNPEKAVEVKRAGMPDGWQENANQLNNFAWWCFENELNLDEAYDFARRGVDLAEAGNMKANVLDTLAEICNLKGDCDEAVTLIHLAIAEDPENAYFQEQAKRFEQAALAQQQ